MNFLTREEKEKLILLANDYEARLEEIIRSHYRSYYQNKSSEFFDYRNKFSGCMKH